MFAELDAFVGASQSLSTAGGPTSGKPSFLLPRFRLFNGDVWKRMALFPRCANSARNYVHSPRSATPGRGQLLLLDFVALAS